MNSPSMALYNMCEDTQLSTQKLAEKIAIPIVYESLIKPKTQIKNT